MKIVIQRVLESSVRVDGELVSSIGRGMMVLVGVDVDDTDADADWLAAKTVSLRIYDDENGVMNRSLKDVEGDVLAVSQFTLLASTKKGNRPSYIRAARHELATHLYERYCEKVGELLGREVRRGIFGADMKVSLINDGPVTIVIDSRQ
jgi:D-tyrosyl-tRNA(Tyr) deacylase